MYSIQACPSIFAEASAIPKCLSELYITVVLQGEMPFLVERCTTKNEHSKENDCLTVRKITNEKSLITDKTNSQSTSHQP